MWQQVSGGTRIVVASGKNVIEYDPKKDDKNEIVAKISGRTGNLRAPALRIGKVYYIGFNEALYEQIGSL